MQLGSYCELMKEVPLQARTQGFEKGGYIVKKIPIECLAF